MMSEAFTLVLQALAPLDPDRLAEIAARSRAKQIRSTCNTVAYLQEADATTLPAIRAQCDTWGWDAAFMPATQRFSDIRLIVSDMDSTLITIECIDEIADMLGIKAQVAAITERSMRGEIDFNASLTERVQLLAGLDVGALDTVYRERLRLTNGAEALVAASQQHGVKFMLVSGGFTYFTDHLKTRLGLDYTFANQLEVKNGKLTGGIVGAIVDSEAKRQLLIQTRKQLGLAPHQVLAVGDGANDLKMLKEAGLGVAFHGCQHAKSR